MATVSFKSDILPLFTSRDIRHMKNFDVHLSDYDWMRRPDNSRAVYYQVSNGLMPPSDDGGDGPWSESRVEFFKAWIDGGYQP